MSVPKDRDELGSLHLDEGAATWVGGPKVRGVCPVDRSRQTIRAVKLVIVLVWATTLACVSVLPAALTPAANGAGLIANPGWPLRDQRHLGAYLFIAER